MGGDGLGHRFPPHAQGDAQPLVHIGIDIHRHRAAEDQRIDDALVDVPGQNDLVAPLAGGQHHALHGTGGAAHHQKGVGRAEGVGGQLLRFPNHGNRMAEIVQRLHAVDVHAHALLSQKSGQLRIAAAPLMTRHVKGNDPHLPEVFQRLVNGCAALIQPGSAPCHVISPSRRFLHNKKRKLHIHSLRKTFEGIRPVSDPGHTGRIVCTESPYELTIGIKNGVQIGRKIRVYIAIILLLLLLTVSQVCAQAHFGYEGTNL